MFDFGFWEIAIIGIITLIVVGPERMPSLARKAGVYAGKLNKFVKKIKFDIDNNLNIYDINYATKNGIVYPSLDPSIFELKYPETDIEGRIVGDSAGMIF